MEIKRFVVIVTLAVLFTLGGEALAQGVGVGASIDVEIIPSSPFTALKEGDKKVTGKAYVVKILCGTIDPASRATPQLVPGTYHTAINVVNLSNSETEVVKGLPPNLNSLTIDFLDGLGVWKFDCTDFSGPGFFEKILLLAVSPKDNLSVTAVYTLKSVEQGP